MVTKHSFLCVPVKCLMISVSHLTARIPLNWRWQAETGSYTSNLITFFQVKSKVRGYYCKNPVSTLRY